MQKFGHSWSKSLLGFGNSSIMDVTFGHKRTNKTFRKRTLHSLKFCLGFVYLLFFIICQALFIVSIINSRILSVHALLFPSHVTVFLPDLSPSMPKAVSSHSSVISGFFVFSNRFLCISFSEVSPFYTNLL